ncbi:Phosphatidylglycerol--prolipoprotein diacylglyceryl transferase [Halomonadaceae bacterium LMG 33818]|uniref:prolipoprotein diacylglyceryl transferase n=1 Tax=Cernens ardua TaxID=3402176 RepID=UPI003EDC088F
MLHYPHFDPVLVRIGPLAVHWYGIMYMIGFVGAWFLARHRAYRIGLSRDDVGDMIFYGALGVVLGGRIGYVLFYGESFFDRNPLWVFKVWDGGMSFHGGLIGVLVAAYVFARRHKLQWVRLLDFIAPIVPIGLGAGRIGNFINQELPGRISHLPWAIDYPKYGPEPRHPSAIYQFLTEGVLLFTILWIVSLKPRKRGLISGLFMLLYGCFRFFTEFFREPDPQLGFVAFGWMTMGQVLCIPMIIIGAAIIAWSRKQPVEYPVVSAAELSSTQATR